MEHPHVRATFPFDDKVVSGSLRTDGQLYRSWRDTAAFFLEAINARTGPRPSDITGLAESDVLRLNHRPRARPARVLTPVDDEFFEGEDLDRLADDAIQAMDSGQTVEFTEMGE